MAITRIAEVKGGRKQKRTKVAKAEDRGGRVRGWKKTRAAEARMVEVKFQAG